MKYSTLDLSRFELENSDTASVIQALVNENGKNRSERRNITKAFGKVKQRDAYYTRLRAKDNENLRDQYQKELNSRLNNANEIVTDGLIDNWKKSTALFAIVMKRKYNWNNGRIGALIQKANDLHIEMLNSGEWDNILKILDDECDIELEVSDD